MLRIQRLGGKQGQSRRGHLLAVSSGISQPLYLLVFLMLKKITTSILLMYY